MEWCERKILFGWSWSNKPNAVNRNKKIPTTSQARPCVMCLLGMWIVVGNPVLARYTGKKMIAFSG